MAEREPEMTEEELAEMENAWVDRGGPSQSHIWTLCSEIRRLWARERELLEANNAEVEKRRAAERSCDVLYQEKLSMLDGIKEIKRDITDIRRLMEQGTSETLGKAWDGFQPRVVE